MTHETHEGSPYGMDRSTSTQQPVLSPVAILGRAAMESAAPGIPDRLEAMMSTISPNMVRRIYEHIWGNVHQDATLGLRDRTIAAIAALTALGNAETNLRLQIYMALNLGLSQPEIVAVIEQTAPIAGFPRAQAALQVASGVFNVEGSSE